MSLVLLNSSKFSLQIANPYNQLSGIRTTGIPQMAGTIQPPLGGGGGSGAGPPLIYLEFGTDPCEADPTAEDRQVNAFFENLLKGTTSVEESVKILYDYATHDDVANKKLLDGILRVLTSEITQHFLDYVEPGLTSIMGLYGGVLAGLVNQYVSSFTMVPLSSDCCDR